MSASVAYTSGYKQSAFTDFSGGLNLRDKADAVGDKEAIDLLNVDFTERGAIKQRDGYTDLTTADLTNRVDSLSAFQTIAGLRQLVAGCGTRLEALNSSGVVVAALTGLTGGPWAFARFGDPTHEYLYCANGVDTLRRWDGAAWTTPTCTVNGAAGSAMPRAGAICVTASTPGSTSATNASNRLVATAFGAQTTAGPGGAQTTPSRVYVSNPGQPEVFETDGDLTAKRGRNFFDLTPGDGEQIITAVSWRELTFIFKETKFFVYWGEGINPADGYSPTFQVREVVNSIGLVSKNAISVGRDGVYFMNRRGVYRTTGGDPVLLSDVIAPMWTQDPDVYFQSSVINLAQLDLCRMLWHMERLYLAVPTGAATANDRTLVYDTQHGWWTLYDWPASALASFRISSRPLVHFGYSSGPNRVGHDQPASTNDRGARMASRWRSGWSDYGASQQKTIRETRVWGAGAVVVSSSQDYNSVLTNNADTLLSAYANWPVTGVGTWSDWLAITGSHWPSIGQVSDALIRTAVRGIVFSSQFSNSSQAPTWSVHRVTRHLREVRGPSVR